MSYLPNARTPNPWIGEVSTPKAGTHARLGQVSSGTSRNLKRGYTGDPEWRQLHGTIGGAVNSAAHALGRYGLYKAALGHVEADLDEIAADVGPHLGAPNTGASPHHDARGRRILHVDGSPLGLPAGARPMPERAERLALGPAGSTGPKPSPFANGPLVDNQFAGFGGRLESSTPPDARSAVGPSMLGSSTPANPAAKLKGRRAPAGMDPRKRGTFTNFS